MYRIGQSWIISLGVHLKHVGKLLVYDTGRLLNEITSMPGIAAIQ